MSLPLDHRSISPCLPIKNLFYNYLCVVFVFFHSGGSNNMASLKSFVRIVFSSNVVLLARFPGGFISVRQPVHLKLHHVYTIIIFLLLPTSQAFSGFLSSAIFSQNAIRKKVTEIQSFRPFLPRFCIFTSGLALFGHRKCGVIENPLRRHLEYANEQILQSDWSRAWQEIFFQQSDWLGPEQASFTT